MAESVQVGDAKTRAVLKRLDMAMTSWATLLTLDLTEEERARLRQWVLDEQRRLDPIAPRRVDG